MFAVTVAATYSQSSLIIPDLPHRYGHVTEKELLHALQRLEKENVLTVCSFLFLSSAISYFD